MSSYEHLDALVGRSVRFTVGPVAGRVGVVNGHTSDRQQLLVGLVPTLQTAGEPPRTITLAYHKLLVEELEKRGFVLKDIVEACPILDMIGLEFNGNDRTWRHRTKRFWQLRRGLLELISKGWATGETLRALAGHLVHFFMLSRPALSVLQNIYVAANATLGTWAPLSGAVRSELRVAAWPAHQF